MVLLGHAMGRFARARCLTGCDHAVCSCSDEDMVAIRLAANRQMAQSPACSSETASTTCPPHAAAPSSSVVTECYSEDHSLLYRAWGVRGAGVRCLGRAISNLSGGTGQGRLLVWAVSIRLCVCSGQLQGIRLAWCLQAPQLKVALRLCLDSL